MTVGFRSGLLGLSHVAARGFAGRCNISTGEGFGEFVGTVTDPSGAVIAGAKVTATEVGTGFARSVNTSPEGFYTIQSLRPSNYTLTVEHPGFRAFTQTGVTLGADQTATVNVKLEVGATTESIQIAANSVQVDTSTSTIRQVVDGSRMVELPLNGRNAAQLTLMVAGAVNSPNGGADQGQTKTFPGAVTISTNGSRQANISYRLDGGNNVDEYTNVNAPFPFPDALQEFSVQTNNYNAEYGQNSGAVVNVVAQEAECVAVQIVGAGLGDDICSPSPRIQKIISNL